MKNILRKLTPLFALIIAITICFSFVGCTDDEKSLADKLEGNDKICYDMVSAAAYQFKNPKSVRVISGTVTKSYTADHLDIEYKDFEKELGYRIIACVRLSATNGYGATTTTNYEITYKSATEVSLDNFDEALETYKDNPYIYAVFLEHLKSYQQTDSFNADKVNAALAEKWENY